MTINQYCQYDQVSKSTESNHKPHQVKIAQFVTVTTHREFNQYVLTLSRISYKSVTARKICVTANPTIKEQKMVINSKGDICIAIDLI